MSENVEKVKCLIVGSGPAGYTAGIYASRADLKPVLYQGMQPGGQLTITTEVENFPGYPEGAQGPAMMEDIKKQAEKFGTDIRWGEIVEADLSQRPFRLKADDGKELLADTVIIATGASARWLGLPSEQEYNGYGVSACATCDGYFYRGKVVAVVGGGDTAAEEVWDSVPVEIVGKQEGFAKAVTGVIVENVKTGERKTLDIDGFFVAIGHKPNSAIFKGQLEMDETGYIITKPDSTRTSVEGVFAAGDIQDKVYRQAVTAAGSGCMAALEAERWLGEQE